MLVDYVYRHFYNFQWNFFDPAAFLASKLLIILFIWLTAAALIFNYLKFIFNTYIMLGWFLNLPMIVATISFSLTLLAKVPNFVRCLPVVLFTMQIFSELNCLANADSSSLTLFWISIDMYYLYEWSLLKKENVWLYSGTFYLPWFSFLQPFEDKFS